MPVIENITVLFTDLVGSTALASALTPEAADALRRRHFSTLRRAIATSGGTEVKNLGDGLMVVFPAASAALACAVAMQHAVERDNARADHPLGLRIGLSAGEATKESNDYFGDPVIQAARLCARAEAGQILVADLVRANAGRRSAHTFASLGELELKGLAEPVETLELEWEPLENQADGTGHIPLPNRLAHRPGVGVIGRGAELGVLGDALKRVSNGAGSEVILIAGEPGQGKSTLVSEVARRAHENGTTVLLGRCDEEVGEPYRPFHEALNHFVTHAEEWLLRFHVTHHASELAQMVPALRQRLSDVPGVQPTDPDSERYLLFSAVVGLLDLASEEQPIVLIVDDLHWADVPSLHLLRYLVANTGSAHMLVLGTYRDAEQSMAQPLTDTLAALRREQAVSFMALQGLDDPGVIAFMESAAGHALDDDGVAFAHAVHRETDGNPFFVAEVLRHLAETGGIVQDGTGRWTVAHGTEQLALPASVRQVIGARVARIGETARTVLSTAAVIGRDFDVDLLAEATAVDESELLEMLDRAQGAALVREVPSGSGRYGFSHALIQHTLYENLGPTRRGRAHRQVAEALERLCGANTADRAAELARHYLLTSRPADTDKAISYARQAGDAALAALAPQDALRHYSQAFDLISQNESNDPTLRIDVLTGLGAAQLQSGVPDFRATLLAAAQEARRVGDADRLMAAALANTRGFHSDLGAIDVDRVEVLEAALAAIPAADSPQRARLLATLCSELTFGSLERRVSLAAEAKAMARRLRDRATLGWVCNLCGVPLRIPSLLEAQFADVKEALALADDLHDPVSAFWVANQGVIEATRAGDFELAMRCLGTMKDHAGRLRQPTLVWTTLFSEAAQMMLHGEPEGSEERATRALEVGTESGQPDAFANYGTQLMGIRLIQGRTGELVDLVADIAARHPNVPTYRGVLASCHLDAGDEGAARRLLQEASDGGFALPTDTTWLDGMVVYARITIELGLKAAARQLVALLEPYRDQVPYQGLTPNPPVATFLGGLSLVLGRRSEADAYLKSGATISTAGGMHFAAAYAGLLQGRLLLAGRSQDDAERARDMFKQVQSSAATRGYALLERRASVELSKLV